MEYVDIHSILWMKLSNILQNAILFGDIVMEFLFSRYNFIYCWILVVGI